jgi:hypothetical protein
MLAMSHISSTLQASVRHRGAPPCMFCLVANDFNIYNPSLLISCTQERLSWELAGVLLVLVFYLPLHTRHVPYQQYPASKCPLVVEHRLACSALLPMILIYTTLHC